MALSPSLCGAASCFALAVALTLSAPAVAQDVDEQDTGEAGSGPSQQDEPLSARPLDGTIVVTGSRIARSGFTAPTPVTVIGEDRIQAFGATNVGEVLTSFPAFRATESPATSGVQTGEGANLGARYLDLRGLGANRTLVLVDGKRFAPTSIRGTVDSNVIPALLIEQIDVVTGGASAAYGSDAVAGVVNIRLNHGLEGIRGQIQGGIAEEGDDESLLLSLAGGTSFADGRGRIVAAVEYADDKGAGGCYTRDWCSDEWAPFNNPNYRPVNGEPANGLPFRIILPHRHPATFTPGGLISGGPLRGTKFLPDGSLGQFEYGTLITTFFMYGGEGHHQNPIIGDPLLKLPVERYNLYSHAEYDLTDDLTFELDLSYGRSKARNRSSTLYEIGLPFHIDNAFLPQEIRDRMSELGVQTVPIGRQGNDFGNAMGYGDTEVWRAALGLNGRISDTWTWDGYYQYGRTDYGFELRNNKRRAEFLYAIDAVVGPDGSITCRSLLDPDPAVRAAAAGCQPLNIIGENNWSQEGYNYVFGTAWQNQRLEQHVMAANIGGTLFETGAGPVLVAAGVEHRRESTSAVVDPLSAEVGWQYGNGSSFTGKVNVTEGYVETNVPLLAGQPFAELLELNGAIRLTDYSTSGRVTTWKLGAIWEPDSFIRFRGTLSRDIRAPNALELFDTGKVSPGRVTDRPSGIDAVPDVRTGGNLSLRPEVARTWTAGVVLQPDFAPSLRLSADWFDIDIEGAIAALGAQFIVDRCADGEQELCSLITRDGSGRITYINAPSLNLNSLVMRGLDVELAYRLALDDRNTFDFRVIGNYVKDLITEDAAGSINRAGQTGATSNGPTGLPEWTLNANVAYSNGPFRLNLEGRYIPEGIYEATYVGPQDRGYDPQLSNSINDNRVDARFYANLGAQYRFEVGGSELELYGVINNLFDQDPPLAPNGIATNAVMFDTIGRTYRMGLRFKY